MGRPPTRPPRDPLLDFILGTSTKIPPRPPEHDGADHPLPPASLDQLARETARQSATGRQRRPGVLAELRPRRILHPRVPPPPHPWYALPIFGADRFNALRDTALYVAPTCECRACLLTWREALAKRRTHPAGRGRVLLVLMREPAQDRRYMVALAHAVRGPNVELSAPIITSPSGGSFLTPPEFRQLARGHVIKMQYPLRSRQVNLRVVRLPHPDWIVPSAFNPTEALIGRGEEPDTEDVPRDPAATSPTRRARS